MIDGVAAVGCDRLAVAILGAHQLAQVAAGHGREHQHGRGVGQVIGGQQVARFRINVPQLVVGMVVDGKVARVIGRQKGYFLACDAAHLGKGAADRAREHPSVFERLKPQPALVPTETAALACP